MIDWKWRNQSPQASSGGGIKFLDLSLRDMVTQIIGFDILWLLCDFVRSQLNVIMCVNLNVRTYCSGHIFSHNKKWKNMVKTRRKWMKNLDTIAKYLKVPQLKWAGQIIRECQEHWRNESLRENWLDEIEDDSKTLRRTHWRLKCRDKAERRIITHEVKAYKIET